MESHTGLRTSLKIIFLYKIHCKKCHRKSMGSGNEWLVMFIPHRPPNPSKLVINVVWLLQYANHSHFYIKIRFLESCQHTFILWQSNLSALLFQSPVTGGSNVIVRLWLVIRVKFQQTERKYKQWSLCFMSLNRSYKCCRLLAVEKILCKTALQEPQDSLQLSTFWQISCQVFADSQCLNGF